MTPHQGSVIPFTSIPHAAALSSQSSPTFCWSSNTTTPTLTAGPEVQHRAHPDPKGVRAMSRAPLCPPTAPGWVGSGGTGCLACPGLPPALHTQPGFWKRCGWQGSSCFTNIDTKSSSSQPRSNIFGAAFNRGDLDFGPSLSSPP